MTINQGDPPRAVDPDGPPRWTSRQVQDLVALSALTVGAVGLVTVGFLWSPLAGMAAVFTLLICVGVYAGLD